VWIGVASALFGACHDAPAPPKAKTSDLAGAGAPDRTLPKIDVHMHVAPDGVATALDIMKSEGIRIGLNASGGYPEEGLADSLAVAKQSGGRLLPFCNVPLHYAAREGFEAYSRALAQQCKSMGGKGLKIPKSLGLGVTDAQGKLLPVDAPVFDALFDEAGKQGLPVLIHSGDPKAFFRAPDAHNERLEELTAHPGWSFYGTAPNGEAWPSWEALLDQFERRVARHPGTTFMGAHFGNAAEEPERVARMLAAHPNLVIDTAARVPELGRHPASQMREFFIAHQDRVLFGSDLGVSADGLTLGSSGSDPDQRSGVPRFFRAHWLYFETNTKGLAHPTPIQGRWTVDGIGLPRAVLDKLYYRNALRVFSLTLPSEPTPSAGH
jgi:predicted TIM-barrel fold metal-dependent hydrolase